MRTRLIRHICFLVIIAVVVVQTGCGPSPSDQQPVASDPAAKLELRAVELPITYSAVTHIAYAKGFVEEEGLDYRVISVPAGPDLISALRAGGTRSADVGSIAVTPTIVMIGAGDHPVTLATGIESNVRVQLVTFSGSGITENPSTLKGKSVGFVGSTVGEIYLSRLLEKAGMAEDDVRAVNGRPADLKALLLRGDLDAAVLWDPFVSQAEREGKKLTETDPNWSRGEPRVYVDPTLYNLTFNIVAMKSKLKDLRPTLVKFLRACVRAGEFIEANPEESRHMLETWLNLEDGDLQHFIETTSFDVHLDPVQMKRDMRTELEWLKRRQPDTMIPEDLSPYIDASLLAEIDPARVPGEASPEVP